MSKGSNNMKIFGNPIPLDYFGPTVCKHYLTCVDIGKKKCLECKNFHPPEERKGVSHFERKPENKIKRGIRIF